MFLALLCVFVFACIITHLILLSKKGSLLDAVKESPASVVEGVICFFSVWSILGLAGFHTYLTTSNQTTNEDIKGSFSSKRNHSIKNPFSQGSVYKNCCVVLCGPNTPSLIDRRGPISDEQYLSAQRSHDLNRHNSSQTRPIANRQEISSPQSSNSQTKSPPNAQYYNLYQQQQQQQRHNKSIQQQQQQQHLQHQQQPQKQISSNITVNNSTTGVNGTYNSLPRNSNQHHSHYGTTEAQIH
jgi:hypothetical protein